jgi:hypothetical protein
VLLLMMMLFERSARARCFCRVMGLFQSARLPEKNPKLRREEVRARHALFFWSFLLRFSKKREEFGIASGGESRTGRRAPPLFPKYFLMISP